MTVNATVAAQHLKETLQACDSCATCRFFRTEEHVFAALKGEFELQGKCQRYPPTVVRLREGSYKWPNCTDAQHEFPFVKLKVGGYPVVAAPGWHGEAWCGEFQRVPVNYAVYVQCNDGRTESAEFTA